MISAIFLKKPIVKISFPQIARSIQQKGADMSPPVARGLKARSVNFKFWHLIKYSETFFGILKLVSYVYRSFCIRFFIRNVFL